MLVLFVVFPSTLLRPVFRALRPILSFRVIYAFRVIQPFLRVMCLSKSLPQFGLLNCLAREPRVRPQ